MITKAIIPVAGWGTRRLPITKVLEKSMLPVGNRPRVDYSVQELIAAGVKDIYMVIGNAEPCQVREFYAENWALDAYLRDRGKTDALKLSKTLPEDVKIHYTVQDPSGKYGTAVPIAMVVEEYHLDEPVLVFMGDDFIWNPGGQSATESLLEAASSPISTASPNPNHSDTSVTSPSPDHSDASVASSSSTQPPYGSPTISSAILGVEVDPAEVEKYGVLSAENDRLVDIVEKPSADSAPSNLINVSKYIMTPDLLQKIVEYVHGHDFAPTDQEYMVTDPIADYLKDGGLIRIAKTFGEYLDGGSLEGWLHANEVVCKG